MSDLEKVGERIRNLRQVIGWSQEELAHQANLHRTYVGGVERGERNISVKNIFAIARALKVPASQLFEDLDTD